MDQRDITQRIISDESVRGKVSSLLPDSVILDTRFNILAISQNILEAIGYDPTELLGQSISVLSHTKSIKDDLEKKLRAGYFDDEHFEIRSKKSGKINFSLSGFYLGLITEVNGAIILRFKNLDEINLMYDRLEAKTTELDRFIYLSSHELRGPLATLKGLINIAKNSRCEELPFLYQQMDVHAQKLDDKFYRLIAFAEGDKGAELSSLSKNVSDIFSELQLETTIHQGGDNLNIVFSSTTEQSVEKGEVVTALLRNLILFFQDHQKLSDHSLHIDAHPSPRATELVIRASNFQFDSSIIEKLKTINFGYAEILHYPELINCYVAKKIVFKLRGNIQFMLSTQNELVVLITLPNSITNTGLSTPDDNISEFLPD